MLDGVVAVSLKPLQKILRWATWERGKSLKLAVWSSSNGSSQVLPQPYSHTCSIGGVVAENSQNQKELVEVIYFELFLPDRLKEK